MVWRLGTTRGLPSIRVLFLAIKFSVNISALRCHDIVIFKPILLFHRAQIECQSHRLTVEDPVSIEYITRYIAEMKQNYTQSNGRRPFGISCLIGGFDYDGNPHLFQTEPSGIYYEWKVWWILPLSSSLVSVYGWCYLMGVVHAAVQIMSLIDDSIFFYKYIVLFFSHACLHRTSYLMEIVLVAVESTWLMKIWIFVSVIGQFNFKHLLYCRLTIPYVSFRRQLQQANTTRQRESS